jgi:hypothetical protein
MSEDDRGAYESMPGEDSFIDWSTHTSLQGLLGISAGTRNGAAAISEGAVEDIEDRAMHIIGVTQYGEVLSNVYDSGGIANTSLNSPHTGDDNCWPGIVKLGNKFHIFQGQENAERKGQVVEMGSSTDIDDIGVVRPVVSSCTVAAAGVAPTYTEVKGTVRYWVSEMKGGNESALSQQIPHQDAIDYYLNFTAADTETGLHSGEDFNKAADWSAEFLFRRASKPSGAECIWSKRADLSSGTAGWSFHVAITGSIHFEASDDTAEETVDTNLDVCDGKWHRITVAYDVTATEINIWVDGNLRQTNSSATWANATTNATSAYVGSAGGASNFFSGHVTDLRCYSATEITDPGADDDLFTAVANPSTKTGLTGYWPCSDGSGSTVTDESDGGADDIALSPAPDWVQLQSNQELGAAVIDLGDGDRVTVTFDSTLYGKKLRVYRSQANGAQPYYLRTFTPSSGTPSFTDSTEDGNLGDLPFLHGDQPPEYARAAVAHANRVFVASGNKLYWTDISSDESYWTADNGNWIEIAPDDGDVITALASDYDSIIIFKANHIYRLNGRRPEEFTLRPLVPGTSIPVSVGAPNINAVCTTPLGVAFYWNRKVFMLSGSQLTRISDPIAEDLNADNVVLGKSNENTEWDSANVGYHAGRNEIWLCLGSNSAVPNKSWIYNLTSREWVGKRDRGYTAMQSIRGVNIWRPDLYDETFIGGTPTSNGRVLNILKSTSKTFWAATPSAYTSSMTLTPFYGNGLNNRKRFRYADIEFEVQSGTAEMDVIWYVDGDPSAATTVPVPTDATQLGIASTRTRAVKRVNINEVGHSLTIKFSGEPNTDGHWKVFGITYGYQDLGSRSR